MHLIDINTLKLEEFIGSEIPRYAILSHRWKDGTEVSFQEWQCADTDDNIRQKEGYAKIMGACRLARADGLQYLWCDTVCIDKTSSAELSEAINSMFAWYRDSEVCYAYLNDVLAGTNTLSKSLWFTRGWTLQELLAPSEVRFFDQQWTPIGDRKGLASTISEVTRIHIGALENRSTIYQYSIAQRMSWAANRQTSREEDIAYCLLGIFGINMPLLYGEGPKAFIRLQKEIIKYSDDQSILAWDSQHQDHPSLTSALAPSPAEFRYCGSIVRNDEINPAAYSITNLGISMKLPLIKTSIRRVVLAGLNCAKELHRGAPHSQLPEGIQVRMHYRVWVPLRYLEHNVFTRVHYPMSNMFLDQNYSNSVGPTPTNLFLSLDVLQPHHIKALKNSTEALRRNPSSFHSGSLILAASGKTEPDGRTFKDAYSLGDVSINQLKHRGPSTASHQLISSGSFSVLLSVFWNEDGLPQEWVHTILFDPRLELSASLASRVEWGCLFDGDGHKQSSQCCSDATAMRSLHLRLQKAYGKSATVYAKEELDPIVYVEEKLLRDSFKQPQLVVGVIFRECQ
ncbi:HET-domain-containing protein [Hypomontagnella monticulosa]|nr:HET-domain-containing protein [Hypomontagnella monticulosa]